MGGDWSETGKVASPNLSKGGVIFGILWVGRDSSGAVRLIIYIVLLRSLRERRSGYPAASGNGARSRSESATATANEKEAED